MARAAITLTEFVGEVNQTPSFGAFDDVNGMYLAAGRAKGALVLEFKNTNAATRNVTVQSGVGGDAGAGWRSDLGDLTFTLEATTGNRRVYIRDIARFTQANGEIWVDATGANVTINAMLIKS